MPKVNHDAYIQTLRNAYIQTAAARKLAAVEIEADYTRRMKEAVEESNRRIDTELADRLGDAVARKVPTTRIRRDVLGTNDWKRWDYWKTLGNF